MTGSQPRLPTTVDAAARHDEATRVPEREVAAGSMSFGASRDRDAQRAADDASERLRLAVDSADIGTWDFEPATGAVTWSARCREIFGLPPDAAVDSDIFLGCVHPDDRARVADAVADAMDPAGNGRYDVEFRTLCRDGSVRWVITKGRAFFAGVGDARTAVRFIGTAVDVSERHHAESHARLLAEASTLLASSLDPEVMLAGVARLAVQTFADYTIVDLVDESGTLVRAAVTHREAGKGDLAQSARRVKPGAAHWPANHPIAAAIREQRVVHTRFTRETLDQIALNDAHRILLRQLGVSSLLCVPLTARGRSLGVISFVRVATQPPYHDAEREVAEELALRTATALDNAQLYRATVAASEAKSDFLASMSHELRTPLTAIIGYEELLADGITGPVTEPQRQQLGRIKASATHLLGLIDEVLTYSRVEAGSERPFPESVDVGRALDEAAAIIEPLVAERGLALVLEKPPEGGRLRTDPQKLRQILVNLLSNASKFTEEGRITLGARREGRQWMFSVRDTGIGIAPENVQHVFQAFWQVEQLATRRVGGTGLGLTVSRRLAHMLGGDVGVESRLGQGSTFTLQLPDES